MTVRVDMRRLTDAARRLPDAAFWLALLLPVFAWAPLTYPGFFEFHSGAVPVFNVAALARQPGDLGWAPAVYRCYDLLRGEGSLPYRLALLPKALGVSFPDALKWVLVTAMLAGPVGVYGWARRALGRWPALAAATVYAYWPLALATVHVRGAVGEAVFLALMPWAWWAAAAVRDTGHRSPMVGLALALAALGWTQPGLAIWLAAALLACLLLPSGSEGVGGVAARRSRGLIGWLAGMALAAVGLLPLILRRGMGEGVGQAFADHLVYPHQLLFPNWGTGPSVPGPYDTLTFQLGLMACGLALVGILLRRSISASAETERVDLGWGPRLPRGQLALSAAAVGGLALLSTTLAAPLWRALPWLARTLTYPWQLLLLTGPWLAWGAGLGARVLADLLARRLPEGMPGEHRSAEAIPLMAGLVTLTLLGSYSYLRPQPVPLGVPDAPLAVFSYRPCSEGGGPEMALLSAEVTGAPGPGGVVTAEVRWQALQPLDRDYTVFFHVVGPDGTLWGQADTMPLDNRFPTSRWRPGQVVADRYQVLLKANAPVGEGYRYLLGLYLWQTGQRLSTGQDDKVELGP